MRWTSSWVAVIGCVGFVAAMSLFGLGERATTGIAEAAKEQPAKAGKTPSAPAAKTPSPNSTAQVSAPGANAAAKSSEEKIVYTFNDQAKLEEFTNLWRQRQAMIVRMTVLQSYWNQEQTTLSQLNNKFATDYKLDVTKNYVLDDKRRVLIEREAPPAPASQAQAPASPANQPTASSPKP